ncbi:hypothetical protein [Sphingosinicella sp. BN140058]|uniref:hypothetical protein n=1 Tax=Sphingosinicella sp. BN140058 TaxID=1892855 RepID=UPI0010123B6B|nr:hypothetical protein [Sphingosinicella sp. BN140058]QAY80261.1 hypothetical protein ETR14_26825 [Sphingosinicella sp. BN140058]
MSNVIIGIIGVVLFIGLAIAGAVYLGPQFTNSKNVGDMAKVTAALSQIVSAVELRQQRTGEVLPSNTDISLLVSEGYLKSLPTNPFDAARPYQLYSDNGARVTNQAVLVVGVDIGSSDRAKDACIALERQAGMQSMAHLEAATAVGMGAWTAANPRPGCFWRPLAGSLMVWAPVAS